MIKTYMDSSCFLYEGQVVVWVIVAWGYYLESQHCAIIRNGAGSLSRCSIHSLFSHFCSPSVCWLNLLRSIQYTPALSQAPWLICRSSLQKDVDAEFLTWNVFTENLRGARAAILCYAVTDPDSWERLQFWVSLALFINRDSTSTGSFSLNDRWKSCKQWRRSVDCTWQRQSLTCLMDRRRGRSGFQSF